MIFEDLKSPDESEIMSRFIFLKGRVFILSKNSYGFLKFSLSNLIYRWNKLNMNKVFKEYLYLKYI